MKLNTLFKSYDHLGHSAGHGPSFGFADKRTRHCHDFSKSNCGKQMETASSTSGKGATFFFVFLHPKSGTGLKKAIFSMKIIFQTDLVGWFHSRGGAVPSISVDYGGWFNKNVGIV
jgi:hypothetical protein